MNSATQRFSASERSSKRSTLKPAASHGLQERFRRREPPGADARAARDVGEREAAARFQHPSPLAKRLTGVGQRREDAFGEHAVEALVRERQSRSLGDDERGPAPGFGVDVDADRRDAAADQEPRRGAEPAADVRHAIARTEPGEVDQRFGQREAAGTQRLPVVIGETAASEEAFARLRGRAHHLSSSACSTFSIRPSASSSET